MAKSAEKMASLAAANVASLRNSPTEIPFEAEDGTVYRLMVAMDRFTPRLLRQMENITDVPFHEQAAITCDILARVIVSWNLADENGPIPCNREAFDDLGMDIITPIFSAVFSSRTPSDTTAEGDNPKN